MLRLLGWVLSLLLISVLYPICFVLGVLAAAVVAVTPFLALKLLVAKLLIGLPCRVLGHELYEEALHEVEWVVESRYGHEKELFRQLLRNTEVD